jgi:hypothetical protein
MRSAAFESAFSALWFFFAIDLAYHYVVSRDTTFDRQVSYINLRQSTCLFWSRRHAVAEQFDGILQALTSFPEIGPEIALVLETREDGFYVQRFGTETCTQFARQ